MRCIVTGASGFVGGALVKRLVGAGHDVVCLSRRDIPEMWEKGVRVHLFDLDSPTEELPYDLKGADVLFHVASKVAMWGCWDDFYRTNVIGTRSLLHLAKKADIKSFVYTSSPSVIANGSDLEGVDESLDYPLTFEAYYPHTKALAEKEVLQANTDTFHTIALRPHLIYGPGDTNMIPTVLERARLGKLIQIGTGQNLVDFSYIDDCITAHIAAASALRENPASRGRAYFISQGDPVPLWEWIRKVLWYNGLPPISKNISYGLAMRIAQIDEAFSRHVLRSRTPTLTRFLVNEMSHHHYFSLRAAEKELSYAPTVSVWEGLRRTFAVSS